MIQNSAHILDGKSLATEILSQIKKTVAQRREKNLSVPGLAVVLVGHDPASKIYVSSKRKACQEVGFYEKAYELPETTSEAELLALIEKLNVDSNIHGILVQLPLPPHISSRTVLEQIRVDKDVDGFHPYNLGRLAQQEPLIRPCTPYGVMKLLEKTGIALAGLHAVVVGASNIVGKPMALELLMAGCTVTVCHKLTQQLPEHVKQADLLVSAVGQAHLIQGDWIKEKAMVVDVGINRLENGIVVGDVDFETARFRASWITPVPGGVGPMTVAMLLYNTLQRLL